jgi:hypothetical protein
MAIRIHGVGLAGKGAATPKNPGPGDLNPASDHHPAKGDCGR